MRTLLKYLFSNIIQYGGIKVVRTGINMKEGLNDNGLCY